MKRYPLSKEHAVVLKTYGLNSKDLEHCTYSIYQTGEYVLTEGVGNEYLFIVISGKAKVRSTASNGKDLILTYYNSYGLLGDMEMMVNAKAAASTVVALSDFECITIPYYKNKEVLQNNITFMNLLAKNLSNKLINSSNDFISAALYTGEQRLCSYILKSASNDFFKENLNEVSSTISMSYRHLLRLLHRLCLEEILQKQNGGYLIDRRF